MWRHRKFNDLLPGPGWLPGGIALTGWTGLAILSWHPPAGLVFWVLGLLALQWSLAFLAWFHSSWATFRFWLIFGILFRVAGLFATPLLDDDSHRFLWDGRMFAVSGNPYGSAPASHFGDPDIPQAFQGVLDRINYPDVPTIYGPVCEWGFLLAYLVKPAALWPWKLLLLAADIAMLLAVKRLAEPENAGRAVVFAAWCPLSIFETGFNAHPDALGVGLLTLGMLAYLRRKDIGTGAACGAAVGAKVFALLLVPFLLWGGRRTAWAVFAIVLLGCYAPFWLQGSMADLTGLRAYAGYWEFNSSGYAILKLVMEPGIARLAAALLFGIGWLVLFLEYVRKSGNSSRLPPGVLVFGLFFFLTPTFNPWYALWLLPFVSLRPSATGAMILVAVSLSYLTRQNLGEAVLNGFAHPVWVRPLEFGLIALVLIVDIYLGRKRSPPQSAAAKAAAHQ